MKKILHIFILISALVVAMPMDVFAEPSVMIIEQEQQPVVSVIGNSSLHVQNAAGMTLYIYNVAGVVIQTIKIQGNDMRIDLNLSKGCYITQVGKVVRKISVR